MRKIVQKGKRVSKTFQKHTGICRTFDDVSLSLAECLENDPNVISFSSNVVLDDNCQGYMSDFLVTETDNKKIVYECISRKSLCFPKKAHELAMSQQYWTLKGFEWKVVIEK